MASGDILARWFANDTFPTATNPALYKTNGNHRYLQFDKTVNYTAIFKDYLPDTYTAGGFTVDIYMIAPVATAGTAAFDVSFARLGLITNRIAADSYSTAKTTSGVINATNGVPIVLTSTFIHATDIDGILSGEIFNMKIVTNNTTATVVGDVYIEAIIIKET